MKAKHRLADNPEIQISFTKQNNDMQKQESRLDIQILRVHTIEKHRAMHQVWTLQQNQLCEYFTNYSLFPQVNISIQRLLDSSKLKLIKSDGKIYFGEVDRKKRQGMGVYVQKDGRLYEGEFYNNQKNGKGIQIYSNGNLYVGEFLNNKKHGPGVFYWFSMSSRNPKADEFVEYYEGEWWGGLPDGLGTHQKINGDTFNGNFKNGLKHGEGVQYYGNGDYYKGEYINGMPQGYGQYLWRDGSSYKGDFKQGERNGYGLWQVDNNRKQSYRGHYSNDKKTGYGLYVWQNGWSYKGNFDNDYRNGYGQLFDADKVVQYRGFWQNGDQTDKQRQVPFNHRSQINSKPQTRRDSSGGDRYGELQSRSRSTKWPYNREDIGQYATLSNHGEFNLCKRPESINYNTVKRSSTTTKGFRLRQNKIGTSISRPIFSQTVTSQNLPKRKY